MTIKEVTARVRKSRYVYGEGAPDRRIVEDEPTRRSLTKLNDLNRRDPRVRALSRVVADDVALNDKFVLRFRKEVLGDQLLSQKGAAQWVSRHGKRQMKSGPPKIRVYGTGTTSLRRLDALSRHLADVYAWTMAEAECFVLTGKPPLVRPLWVTVASRRVPALSRLVLTIDPMIPPTEVAAFYQRVRRMFHSGRTRRLSEKHAQLAAFVLDRPPAERWAVTMSRWNGTRPKKYDYVSNFRRDCGRAIKRLVGDPVSATRRHSSRRSR